MLQAPASYLASSGLLIWALLCAIQDSQHKRISNWLTLLPAAVAAGFLLWHGHSLSGSPALAVLLALLLAVALSLPGYVRGSMGAGDVKLLAALALASGPLHVLGSIAGAAISMLIWSLAGPSLWRRFPESLRLSLKLLAPGQKGGLPYAPFFFCGLLGTLIFLS